MSNRTEAATRKQRHAPPGGYSYCALFSTPPGLPIVSVTSKLNGILAQHSGERVSSLTFGKALCWAGRHQDRDRVETAKVS
jgi:hypothetical protein